MRGATSRRVPILAHVISRTWRGGSAEFPPSAGGPPAEGLCPTETSPSCEYVVRIMTRVLVVDDDSELAEMWAARLTRAGFDARAVFDPLAALEQAPRFAPDVALLDIGLPGMDGHELGSRLRAIKPTIALIAITGNDSARRGERSDALGFDAHLVKPVRLFDLERMIRVVMTHRDDRQPGS